MRRMKMKNKIAATLKPMVVEDDAVVAAPPAAGQKQNLEYTLGITVVMMFLIYLQRCVPGPCYDPLDPLVKEVRERSPAMARILSAVSNSYIGAIQFVETYTSIAFPVVLLASYAMALAAPQIWIARSNRQRAVSAWALWIDQAMIAVGLLFLNLQWIIDIWRYAWTGHQMVFTHPPTNLIFAHPVLWLVGFYMLAFVTGVFVRLVGLPWFKPFLVAAAIVAVLSVATLVVSMITEELGWPWMFFLMAIK